MHSLSPFFSILTVLPFAISDATPLVIPWNTTHSYGPDGPWPVVTVQVGSSDAAGIQPLSTVDLYPGGIWESIILRGNFCDRLLSDGSTQCLAAKAGIYNLSLSETAQQGFTQAPGLVWQWGSGAVDHVSGVAVNVLDTMVIPELHGTFVIPNSTISAVSAWHIELPDGTTYSTQVGTLSLGAPGAGIQTFGATALIGQTIPGYAYGQGAVAINSWGLHYGSASLNQEGSLVFGGYDQSRVLGDVGTFDLGAESTMLANLLDVELGVENGSLPFGEGTYTGLLKQNASFNGAQPTVINPIVPYLYMSPETCTAVTKNLPVTFNSQVGLYIWDTTDPRYERIIKSPAYLAFVFRYRENGNLTVKVPFRLLNLTLEAPIVTTAQQYFPCRPFYALDHTGSYYLGKAFLQAAFIGMNWQKEKFFLAQAPGLGVRAAFNIKPIGLNDITIDSDPIENFAVTWARDWTALSGTDNSRNTTVLPTGGTNGQKGTSDVGYSKNLTAIPAGTTNGRKGASDSALSSRNVAGIAVGVTVGALAVAGAVMLYYLRRRKTSVPPQEKDASHEPDTWVYETDGRTRIFEVGEGLSHEADADHGLHELDSRERS